MFFMESPSSHMTPSASRDLEMSNDMGDHHFPFDPIPLELFDQQSGQLHEYPPRDAESGGLGHEEDEYVDEELGLEEERLGAMKEMMYRIAAMQPVDIDPSTIKKPRRRNVRISDDPQSVAARHRRERISERIRTLQQLVPGGTKMDTASMLDEAVRYVKFLKRHLHQLESSSPAAALLPQVAGPLLGAVGRNPVRDAVTSSALPFTEAPNGLGFYGFHD